MLDYIKKVSLNVSSIKILFYVLGFLLSVPVIGMLYWIFDTSYLAEFGIGPELYSRPIFSSSLINAWLFASVIGPSIWIWTTLSGILFCFLVIAYYEKSKIKKSPKLEEKTDADTTSFLYKIDSFFNFIFKAGPPALVFLFSGLSIIAFTSITIMFLSNESSKLASNQIKAYIKERNCKDAFNNYHLGCYIIPGETGDNHLLILNNKDVTIYMSRQSMNDTSKETFTITVKNRVTQEKTVRLYNYAYKTESKEK